MQEADAMNRNEEQKQMAVGRPQVVEIIEEDKQEYESDHNSEEVEEVKNQIID